MTKSKEEIEYKGQFPSKNCECHFQKPYGFVPEAGCLEHDTKQFLDFVDQAEQKGRQKAIKEIVELGNNIGNSGGRIRWADLSFKIKLLKHYKKEAKIHYECNHIGKCKHCDKRRTDTHIPEKCALCNYEN